jgi:hypothetical protein
MSTSSKNHSASPVAALIAGVAMFGSLSPAAASDQNNRAVLTSHSPWLAPIGHRQPARADVPQTEVSRRPGSASNRISMSNSIES